MPSAHHNNAKRTSIRFRLVLYLPQSVYFNGHAAEAKVLQEFWDPLYYLILILRIDLEFSHHGTTCRHRNEMSLKLYVFTPHCNSKILVARGRVGMTILEK